jgi:hypothetical protein
MYNDSEIIMNIEAIETNEQRLLAGIPYLVILVERILPISQELAVVSNISCIQYSSKSMPCADLHVAS